MSKIKVGKKSYEEKEVKKNILKLNILSFVLNKVIKKDTALTSGIWRILG